MPRNGTRKSDLRRRGRGADDTRKGRIRRILGTVFRYPTVSALATLALMWLAAWLAMSDTLLRFRREAGQAVLTQTAQSGFSIRKILIEGRQNVESDALKDVIRLSWGDPIFAFDADALRERVESLPWVRHARVERRLPDTVYIRLEERTPMALWQIDGSLRLIDDGGTVLATENLGRFRALPMVVGPGAAQEARTILGLIEAEPVLRNRVAAAVRVGGRRWDLRLTNDLTIKLPEQGAEVALRRAAEAQSQDGIFDRGLLAVDLREADRMILRTTPPAAEPQTLARKEP